MFDVMLVRVRAIENRKWQRVGLKYYVWRFKNDSWIF